MMARSNPDLLDRFSRLRAYDEAWKLVQELLLRDSLPASHPWATARPETALETYAAHRAAVDITRMSLGYYSTEATHYLSGYVRHFLSGLRHECKEALTDIAGGVAPADREPTIRAALVVVENLLRARLASTAREI